MSLRTILVAFGANLSSSSGPPARTLTQAAREVAEALAAPGEAAMSSRLYATPCFPAGAGPDYVNGALAVRSRLGPAAALAELHRIEARHGRERSGRWAGRTLDLDLIAAGDLVLPDPATLGAWIALPPERQRTETPDRLLLPHPRLQDRGFVLVPLAELAPDWRHPLLGRTVREMRDALPAAALAEIRPIAPGG